MKKVNREEKNKITYYYSKIKEIWSDPKKKAGIKLVGYFILFLMVFILSGIANNIKQNNKDNISKNNIKTTIVSQSLTSIEKTFLSNNHTINYVINIGEFTYKLNGTIKNNITEGYLESDTIFKIKLENSILYEIKGNIEKELSLVVNPKLIDITNVFKLVENSSPIINSDDNKKEYSYNIEFEENNYNVIICIENNKIAKIKINGINIEYILDFDK